MFNPKTVQYEPKLTKYVRQNDHLYLHIMHLYCNCFHFVSLTCTYNMYHNCNIIYCYSIVTVKPDHRPEFVPKKKKKKTSSK